MEDFFLKSILGIIILGICGSILAHVIIHYSISLWGKSILKWSKLSQRLAKDKEKSLATESVMLDNNDYSTAIYGQHLFILIVFNVSLMILTGSSIMYIIIVFKALISETVHFILLLMFAAIVYYYFFKALWCALTYSSFYTSVKASVFSWYLNEDLSLKTQKQSDEMIIKLAEKIKKERHSDNLKNMILIPIM